MADNVNIDESVSGSATKVDADEITRNAQTVKRQVVGTAPPDGTATLSSVAGATSSAQLLAANSSRLRAVIVNDSTAVLYVKFGTTASSSSYSFKLAAGDTLVVDDYNGRIDGIWASATGNARVTEIS